MKKSLCLFLSLAVASGSFAQDSHYKEGAAASSETAPAPSVPPSETDPSAPKADHRDATTADKDAMSQEDKSYQENKSYKREVDLRLYFGF